MITKELEPLLKPYDSYLGNRAERFFTTLVLINKYEAALNKYQIPKNRNSVGVKFFITVDGQEQNLVITWGFVDGMKKAASALYDDLSFKTVKKVNFSEHKIEWVREVNEEGKELADNILKQLGYKNE